MEMPKNEAQDRVLWVRNANPEQSRLAATPSFCSWILLNPTKD